MRSSRRALVLGMLLATATAHAAPASVRELVDRLKNAEDFRVRLQAALELGKTADPDALEPLTDALGDANASVRAAAAAALGELGDADAIPALKEHRLDRSEAVRKQIKLTLARLSGEAGQQPPARLLVKIGAMRNATAVKSKQIEAELEQESRKKLDELPGVRVIARNDEASEAGAKSKLPVVLVSGHVQRLQASRDGTDVVYSASVEYILHTMPDESIATKVSGSASGTLSQDEAKNESRAAELRHQVLGAAIASALRRAPRALLAAARL
jgi:hypothetical protein